MTAYDVVVVGGGILGAATLYALARQGRTNCLLLEQGEVASGATGRSGAMMRVFHRDPWLSDLTAQSLDAFRRFMGETGQTCGYVETGAMYIASTADRDWVAAEVARLQAKGIAIRLWNAVEARRHVAQSDEVRRQQRRDHQRQDGILGAADRIDTFERPPAANGQHLSRIGTPIGTQPGRRRLQRRRRQHCHGINLGAPAR